MRTGLPGEHPTMILHRKTKPVYDAEASETGGSSAVMQGLRGHDGLTAGQTIDQNARKPIA
jgi:hypothetical protein